LRSLGANRLDAGSSAWMCMTLRFKALTRGTWLGGPRLPLLRSHARDDLIITTRMQEKCCGEGRSPRFGLRRLSDGGIECGRETQNCLRKRSGREREHCAVSFAGGVAEPVAARTSGELQVCTPKRLAIYAWRNAG